MCYSLAISVPRPVDLKIVLQQGPKTMLLVGTINRLAAQIDAYMYKIL